MHLHTYFATLEEMMMAYEKMNQQQLRITTRIMNKLRQPLSKRGDFKGELEVTTSHGIKDKDMFSSSRGVT